MDGIINAIVCMNDGFYWFSTILHESYFLIFYASHNDEQQTRVELCLMLVVFLMS